MVNAMKKYLKKKCFKKSLDLGCDSLSLKHFKDSNQEGFVLVTAMIFLLVLTLFALVIFSQEARQQSVSNATNNALTSFQTADGALSEAEGKLLSNQYTAFTSNTAGQYLYNPASVQSPLWQRVSWDKPGDVIVGSFKGESSLAPRYIIEQLPSVVVPGQSLSTQQYGTGAPLVKVYRITAKATGRDAKTSTTVHSIFRE